MFGKNSAVSNNPQNKNLTTEEKINLNEDNFKLEDFPIHTMKEDLKELQNPSIKKETPLEINEPTKTFSFDAKPPTDSLEKKGPFFNPEIQEKPANNAPKIAEIKSDPIYFDESIELPKKTIFEEKTETPTSSYTPNIAKPNPLPEFEEKKPQPKEIQNIKQNIPEPHHGIGKAIAIAVVIFIILIAGAGGYYFWMTRVSVPLEQNIITENEETLPLEEEIIPSETETQLTLSSQNSNYLQINLNQATAESLKQTLDEYALKVSKTNEVGAFEFLITDETNTPVTFQDFATTLNINLSTEISAQIGQDFSLYIYNYGEKTRFGLALTVLNDAFLKTALSKEEANLFTSLSPFYPNLTLPAKNIFSPAIYKNYTVRYLNITSPEDYAVDYATIGNKLVIGTTRETLYSILDKLSE